MLHNIAHCPHITDCDVASKRLFALLFTWSDALAVIAQSSFLVPLVSAFSFRTRVFPERSQFPTAHR
jgi:hypothetical protein